VPIYEYQCDHCEHKMEAIQKMSDKPLKDCPECKQETLRKLVSAAAFKLKGDGWYETDFKDQKPKKKDAPEKEGRGKGDKGKDKSRTSKDKGNDKSGKKSEAKTTTAKKQTSTAGSTV